MILEIISGEAYLYGYKKINADLQDNYKIIINHKKTYRLCKELDVLRPQRKIYPKRPKKLANKGLITGPNKLWEMDLKYGFIVGEKRFFYQLSLIDVYDKTVIDYHLGLTATAKDASAVLKNSLKKRGFSPGMELPVIRTDNGTQFTANEFEKTCQEWGMQHHRIPVKTPNMIAFIESFHSILKEECYDCNEFRTYIEAYLVISQFMEFYNKRRRHGSIRYMSPEKFYESYMNNQVLKTEMVA